MQIIPVHDLLHKLTSGVSWTLQTGNAYGRTPSLAERRDEVFPVILHIAEWFAVAARTPAVSSAGASIAPSSVITAMTSNARIASMAAKTVVMPAMSVSPVPSVSAKIGKAPGWSVRVSSIRIRIWIR